MGDWSTFTGGYGCDAVGISGTSTGTVITASASTNTKGSYTQLTASTPIEAAGFWLQVTTGVTAVIATNMLLDIAIGTAGEEVLISNLMFAKGSVTWMGGAVYVPVHIPQGSRIAARLQGSVASSTCAVSLLLIPPGPLFPEGFGACDTMGADTATSTGVLITPSGTANTKGSYAEITASTARAYGALIAACIGGAFSKTACNETFDIAVGAATEAIIVPDVGFSMEGNNDMVLPFFFGPFPVDIPAGSRIAVRAQSSITAAARVFDVVLYGCG